jgi:ketosteroid isomerase-like protein
MGMLFRPRPALITLAAWEQHMGDDPGSVPAPDPGVHAPTVLRAPEPLSVPTNRVRAQRLVRAVRASVAGASTEIADLYTEDVRGWSPTGTVSSAAELAVEFEDRDEAFSEVEVVVVALDVGGDQACVEWIASVEHTGALTLEGAALVDATGRRLTLRGVTVAEFDGERICSFRQYWNELELLDQLRLAWTGDEGATG